ncbi:MAG TPA: ATP-binding protein [Bryobacteraceae bacterium]|nr:ATP-binding protein [Bryobacteraceae bacterium]
MPISLIRGWRLLPVWVWISGVVMLLTLAGVQRWKSYSEFQQFRGKTFRIGLEHNPPTLDWSTQKGAHGFAVDVLQEAALRSGIVLEWVLCARGSRAALQDGEIDLWPVGYYRPGEYPQFHQTRPWTEDQHAFVWDGDRFPIEPDSWDGHPVAVMNRLVSRTLAHRLFPRMQLYTAESRREVMEAVCRGAADVAFLDMRVVENTLLDRPASCRDRVLRVKPLPEVSDPMTIFSRPEHRAAAEALRSEIDEMLADGTLLNLAEKWFSFSSSDLRQVLRLEGRTRQLRWLTAVCGAMALIIGLLIVLVRKLRSARTIAERARILQSEFLANVSHEIRTPMNGVLGTADLLLDTVDDPEVREQVETIRESAYGQLELLNQILDQSKIDSGVLLLEMTPFSIRKLVEQVEKTFQPAARRKGLHLSVQMEGTIPALVQGDGLRIRQVLTNLVNNAIKFTSSGAIKIGLRGSVAAGLVTIEYTITDTGIGIPKEVQGTIFERFRQVDASTTRRYGGTGLGLSISRQLVRLMGGELTVESDLGKGSTFRFRLSLPVARMTEPEVPAPTLRSDLLAGLSILVAEDNPVNQRVALAMLTRLGADVELAATGAEAVERCKHREFDAVLMDCHMPEMDGYEATAAIRRLTGAVRSVPIVALTAGASGEERRKALQAGMDGFLAKPVSREELAATLAALPRREHPH